MKVKVDLKSIGKTKKRLKICPIERKDLKEHVKMLLLLGFSRALAAGS